MTQSAKRIDGWVHSQITEEEICLWREHPCNTDGDLRILLFRKPDVVVGEYPFPEGIATHQRLVDPFGDRIGLILDRECTYMSKEHWFRPNVMFDSNAIDVMVQASKAMKGDQLKEVPKWGLVDPIVASRYDLNLDFYVYETLRTNGVSEATLDGLIDPVARIFEIGNCQREPWLKERKLVVDLDSVRDVFEAESVRDFKGLAKAHINLLLGRWKDGMSETFEQWESASYLMLLKTIALSSNSTKPVVKKMEQLRAFEVETLGVSFMREKLFAALFLEGRYQPARDFILKDLKKSGLRAKLRGSARDLLLPRFAERFLSANLAKSKILVPHILTFDRPLLGLASPIRIHHMYSRIGESAWSIVYDFEHLKKQFAKPISLDVINALASTPRMAVSSHRNISGVEIKEIMDVLEKQVANWLCVNL